MAWKLLGSSQIEGTPLDFYGGEDGSYMIRAGGLELMNSASHESEDYLGALAARFATGERPRVLIGGLGLGYTLLAAATALGGAAEIHVAEISPAVAGWVRQQVLPSRGLSWPHGVRLHIADVREVARSLSDLSVIALDVDNGPAPFSTAGNDGLYSAAGLGALIAALRPDGTLLIWSGFRAPGFEATCDAMGLAVEVMTCRPPGSGGLDYFIYALSPSRRGAAPAGGLRESSPC